MGKLANQVDSLLKGTENLSQENFIKRRVNSKELVECEDKLNELIKLLDQYCNNADELASLLKEMRRDLKGVPKGGPYSQQAMSLIGKVKAKVPDVIKSIQKLEKDFSQIK